MADVAAILGVTTCPKKRALVVLCGRAGLRVSEAVAVTPADVKTDDSGTPWITVMGKGAKQRRVPLGPDSWEIFKPAYVEAVVNKTTVVGFQERRARQIITDLAAQAKVSRRVSSHNLRATFLTDVLERTKDLAAAQDLAGHSSPETTRIYTETSEARMKEAVETL